jgi:hypothetical protein
MLRGGLCRPAARERVLGVPRHRFESDLVHGFGFRSRSWTPGGNPPSLDSKRGRVGPQPGQGHEPCLLGLLHQGTQERVLLWWVKRGGAEFENSAPVRSELETWPASKPAQYFAFYSLCQELISLFIRRRPALASPLPALPPWIPQPFANRAANLPPCVWRGILNARENRSLHA